MLFHKEFSICICDFLIHGADGIFSAVLSCVFLQIAAFVPDLMQSYVFVTGIFYTTVSNCDDGASVLPH
jgi:hypothetical protein